MTNTIEQPRSIWANINHIVTGIANALGSTTQAVAKTAEIAESLADTGLVMANNNKEIVIIKSNFDKEIELKRLDDLINNSISEAI